MGKNNTSKPVHLRLREEERKRLHDVVEAVSGTRSELMRESIYLLIQLWKGLS